MPDNKITPLDIKELLNGDDQYLIPVYQRNYAWEAKEIEQLIQDIIDYSKYHKDKNYYIGTLVVAAEHSGDKEYFNTIDGQQRLTTLTILSSVIKNKYKEIDLNWFHELNLRFASREKSMLSLKAVFNGEFEDLEYEVNIKAAYDICSRELEKKTKENEITIKDFTYYLYNYVKILRVPLPDGIDLNHYFEIMNSRGEQLEKHEILKAKLMGYFKNLTENDVYYACFDLIWEACSNMEKYVQYGFTTEQRHIAFGHNDWNSLAVHSFDDFVNKISHTLVSYTSNNGKKIDEIINEPTISTKNEENDDAPDRFNSVVNFQNFLLHVLRVQTANDDVALDDKRLIDLFDEQLPKDESERVEFVKEFIFNLLKCKFLFDKYVIKREFTANTNRWSLRSLKWYSVGKTKNGVKYINTFGDEQGELFDSDNRRILMLLSMFHVSIPSMSYKYWLNAALNYSFNEFEVESISYIQYLEHIAKSFVFDRYLSASPIPANYFDMIYKNLHPIRRDFLALDLNKLRYGNIENNLIFNFCDYLLWLKYRNVLKDIRVKSFEYTFRSSVEHHYPQNPINNVVPKINESHLHSFGNLCLISHEKNSRLNNHSPEAKKDYYKRVPTLDSIKQYQMMIGEWNIKEIEAHEKDMLELLKENIDSDFKPNHEASLAVKWFREYREKDKVLLVRALLCFGDCVKHISGNKYNLFDFEYMRNHEAFQKFEEYVELKSPKSLLDIVHKHINSEKLKNNYRYLFIKYPETIEYCKNGNFQSKFDDKLIYLLESEKHNTYVAKELYTYIISNMLLKRFNVKAITDSENLYIRIGYNENGYYITDTKNEQSFILWLWNKNGEHIEHCLENVNSIHGNSIEIKSLSDYKWEISSDGHYERFGRARLLQLEENYEENLTNTTDALLKVLKMDWV
jgi:hypothetical protein